MEPFDDDFNITFAGANELELLLKENIDIVLLFFEEILQMNFYKCFISDNSSLYDICLSEEDLDECTKLIKANYGVDLLQLEDIRIITVLKAIKWSFPYIQ